MLLHHRRRRARAKPNWEGGAKQGIACSRAPHTRRPRVSSAEVLRQAPNLDVLRRTASQLTCTDHPPSHTWPSLTAQVPSSLSLLWCLADPHTPPPWCRGPNLVLCASSVYVRTSCLVFGLLSNAPSAHARLFSDCIAVHGPSLAVSGRPPTRRHPPAPFLGGAAGVGGQELPRPMGPPATPRGLPIHWGLMGVWRCVFKRSTATQIRNQRFALRTSRLHLSRRASDAASALIDPCPRCPCTAQHCRGLAVGSAAGGCWVASGLCTWVGWWDAAVRYGGSGMRAVPASTTAGGSGGGNGGLCMALQLSITTITRGLHSEERVERHVGGICRVHDVQRCSRGVTLRIQPWQCLMPA